MKPEMEKSTWIFSAKESTITFKVKYYKISSISGIFKEFSGSVSAYEGFQDAEILLSLKTDGIELNSKQENRSVRKAECLDEINYPKITFTAADGCKLSQGNIREITGVLTIKGISVPLTLIVNFAQVKKGGTKPVCTVALFGCIRRSEIDIAPGDDKLEDEIIVSAQIELRRATKSLI
ncbi:YceI family protein [Mucilaginibacter sp. 22184]|uniref:YceI family protein n=1 Tax=Mucilaginibacter sp. 22184 TaxID=3453887 RepID=UPI003F848A0A